MERSFLVTWLIVAPLSVSFIAHADDAIPSLAPIDFNRFALLALTVPPMHASAAKIEECQPDEDGKKNLHASNALDTTPFAYDSIRAKDTSYESTGRRLLCPDTEDTLANSKEKLSAFVLDTKNLVGSRILSLGEGEPDSSGDGIVSTLLDLGVDAYAVDLDDAYKAQSENVFKAHPGRFIYGDATQFSTQPFAKEGFDQIISSHLLCELDNASQQKAVLLESLKALRPNGTARHIFGNTEVDPTSDAFRNMLADVLKEAKKLGMVIEYFSARGYLDVANSKQWHRLLIFRRLK